MSHAPITSSDPTLESLLNEVVKNTNLNDPRSRAMTIEAYQRYGEYLDELKDTPVKWDTSVTIRINSKTLRFPNMQAMADFLMELT